MSFQLNLPPSVVAQMARTVEEEAPEGDAKEEGKKREDWRKMKELEEARKAGTAPAMKDEEGKDINPHIPQYIMQAPWYFGAPQATLRHQRAQPEKHKEFSTGWYNKGLKEGPVATKFRKGACTNCGAMTHEKKDCLERPRRVGARYTGSDIAPDEYLPQEMDFDFDGKRDRWNGYDPAEHKKISEEYQKIDEAKRILKAQRIEEAVQKGEIDPEEAKRAVEDDNEDDNEEKYVDDVDMPGQKFESKQRITVRNLRIREDTAKYLYNLDVNSAYYDPKTRSMRENPFQDTGKESKELPYAGDNFVRFSGDAMTIAKQQLFAWEAYEKGSEVNLQADPTKLDMLTREYTKKKDDYKQTMKEGILNKYGGLEHLEAPPKQLLLAQTTDYVEYSRSGVIIKGHERAKVKSIYEEDVYPNNHKSVWGSFWKDGQWGYNCCNSFIRESYCTGEAGKSAEQTSLPDMEAAALMPPPAAPPTLRQADDRQTTFSNQSHQGESTPQEVSRVNEEPSEERPQTSGEAEREKQAQEMLKQWKKAAVDEKKKKKKQKKKKEKKKRKKKKKKESSSESSSDSEASSEEDEEYKTERKVKEAIAREEKRVREVDKMMRVDERKRPYNIMYDLKAPSEDDLEAYKRKRLRDNDPMAQFM